MSQLDKIKAFQTGEKNPGIDEEPYISQMDRIIAAKQTIAANMIGLETENTTQLFDIFWKEFLIGKLSKNAKGEYVFKYNKEEVEKARKKGFDILIGFNNLEQEYVNEKLFPIFASRIPPTNRHDMEQVLKKLDMETFDEIEFLKRTQGRTATDPITMISSEIKKRQEIETETQKGER